MPTRIQNLKSLALAVPVIFHGVKTGHATLTMPLSGKILSLARWDFATVNLCTKFCLSVDPLGSYEWQSKMQKLLRVRWVISMDLENLATASGRCIDVINKLADGQLVDYTYDHRARHS